MIPFAIILQDSMVAAPGSYPDTPLEHRHLILAYAAVFLIQLGYAGWVILQRIRLCRRSKRSG
jgi:hypothetical protein